MSENEKCDPEKIRLVNRVQWAATGTASGTGSVALPQCSGSACWPVLSLQALTVITAIITGSTAAQALLLRLPNTAVNESSLPVPSSMVGHSEPPSENSVYA